jgi:hypothetical protein
VFIDYLEGEPEMMSIGLSGSLENVRITPLCVVDWDDDLPF